MEERALYRAILTCPHDDALRLAYADWLDENADALPHPLAERGRAELIRIQCERARRGAGGWRAGTPPAPDARERRLLFRHGRAWRGAHSVLESSAPFDRGFLRPFRALTAQQFMSPPPEAGTYHPFQPLPLRSPARRHIPTDDGPFAACPLWDVHLYAPGWLNDPNADRGQYGLWLALLTQSPALRQVGWLKVSFFRTPVAEFLRAGRFDNVETLVLNSGPFPDVLAAVADNPSFRSLRYITFGGDLWAWAPTYPERVRFYALQSRLAVLNDKHLPFGAMRDGLRSVLLNTPLILPAPPVSPWPQTPLPPAPPTFTRFEQPQNNNVGTVLGSLAVVAVAMVFAVLTRNPTPPTPVEIRMPEYKAFDFKMPEYKPLLPEYPLFAPGDSPKSDKELQELQALMKKWQESQPDAPPGVLPPPWARKRLPVAPPPRPVERAVAPPPRAVEE